MGLFHHKTKTPTTPVVEEQNFVIYLLPLSGEAKLREEFDHAFGFHPKVSLVLSRPSAIVASKFAARDERDHYLTVTPTEPLGAADKERVIVAVQTATRAAGAGSFCPVR